MSIGIYKITSPTGKVYIGQSVDIKKRWNQHKNKCHPGKLKSSFMAHGFKNHIFEIIEKCEACQLQERERHWQDHYDVLGENGLNLSLTDTAVKKQIFSEETRQKMSKSKKEMSQGTKIKMSKSQSGKFVSEETRSKMSSAKRGTLCSEETKQKIAAKQKGVPRKPVSVETKLKLAQAAKEAWVLRRSKNN